MNLVPPEVMAGELDLMWQSVFTWASWGIVVIMLLIALRMGVKQKTPFYVFAVLAAGVGAYIEPLYDVAFDLWFYDVSNGVAGAMWSHFTAFGIVQPNWTHSGYMILYSSACLYAGRALYEGRISTPTLFLIWLAEITVSCIFEMVGTGTGVYTYYGPYVMRIWNYPLVIGVLEGTQVILFTVLAVQFWRRVNSPIGLLGLFVIFPITMMGANGGLGAPIIIALHLSDAEFSQGLIWASTFLTYGLCILAVYGASKFIPEATRKVEARDPSYASKAIPA
ncbi:hypothetical protein [Zhongshania sp. BJYM1]|jgi:hypothetical protein|uniref:hypothetical protein n=1 Tax=Zhongshania aquatica TaxID=2965069 RepID=UPI0022B457CA|nr:hypothetical protein [Marortus sp. BJYM1]